MEKIGDGIQKNTKRKRRSEGIEKTYVSNNLCDKTNMVTLCYCIMRRYLLWLLPINVEHVL